MLTRFTETAENKAALAAAGSAGSTRPLRGSRRRHRLHRVGRSKVHHRSRPQMSTADTAPTDPGRAQSLAPRPPHRRGNLNDATQSPDRTDAVRGSCWCPVCLPAVRQKRVAPLVFNMHFTGTMDHWDPAVTDGFARGSRGHPVRQCRHPRRARARSRPSIEEMAADGRRVSSRPLGLTEVDVLGFSLGGLVAQTLAIAEPKLVRPPGAGRHRPRAVATAWPRWTARGAGDLRRDL